MNTKIKITNNASLCVIDIEGIIGVAEQEQFSPSSRSVATYEGFCEEIAKIKAIDAEEIVVNIRSVGGDVNDALLIFESLSSLNAKITTRCYGYTASAATIIAQAASEGCREVSASSLYLVHKSSSIIEGNASDLAERIDLLEKTDDRIATLYALRSSRDKSEFEQLMSENGGNGRWLSPEEAVAAGLADAIIGSEPLAEPTNIFDKVKGWFATAKAQPQEEMAPSDTNILHLPSAQTASTSALALEMGQQGICPTHTTRKEDPSLDEVTVSHNALAYAEDARNLNFRLRREN